MKLLGLLGGMSWQSTVVYYQLANRLTAERLGPLHSARILLHSVEFAEVEVRMREGRWIIFEELVRGRVEESSRQALREMSRRLIRTGAEGIVLACTELQMLLGPGDLEVPVFDTTALHMEEAVRLALEAA